MSLMLAAVASATAGAMAPAERSSARRFANIATRPGHRYDAAGGG
jgi:hypothetical protein